MERNTFVITQIPSKELITDLKTEIVPPVIQVRPSASEVQFKCFAILWGVAALFHMAHSSTFDAQLNLALLTASAFYVIFRPTIAGFLVLILLQLFDVLYRMPYTTNHWLFSGLVNLTILQVWIFLMYRKKSFNISGGELFKTFSPLVRIEVIILYFFAFFHKLNSGFLSPETSCATDLLKAQHVDAILALDQRLFALNAYLTLAIEASIPLFLCFRKTRNLAVMLGLIFHLILGFSSYNAFFDFSSMIFAAYFLFLSPAFSEWLYDLPERARSVTRSFFKTFAVSKFILFLAMALVLCAALFVMNQRLDSFQRVHLYFFWTLYSFLFTGCFVAFLYSRKQQHKDSAIFKIAHWSLLLVPVIVFLNGTSPYLGLKTENSYAMFSNLRTEGGISNHLIVPAYQPFHYQKDIVQIVSSTDPGLAELARENKAMVLFEFRNYVRQRRPGKIEYTLNGQRFSYARADMSSAGHLKPDPFILTKLMKFRTFNASGPQGCAH